MTKMSAIWKALSDTVPALLLGMVVGMFLGETAVLNRIDRMGTHGHTCFANHTCRENLTCLHGDGAEPGTCVRK